MVDAAVDRSRQGDSTRSRAQLAAVIGATSYEVYRVSLSGAFTLGEYAATPPLTAVDGKPTYFYRIRASNNIPVLDPTSSPSIAPDRQT